MGAVSRHTRDFICLVCASVTFKVYKYSMLCCMCSDSPTVNLYDPASLFVSLSFSLFLNDACEGQLRVLKVLHNKKLSRGEPWSAVSIFRDITGNKQYWYPLAC